MKKTARGFTLIEILVVIGIIAILAAVVIIAINPGRQFAQANNTTRASNVNTILNAIGQNMADNKGQFVCGTVTLPAATSSIGTAGVDLTCLTPTYLSAIPVDPVTGTDADTGYSVAQNATTLRVSVQSDDAELGEVILVTR
jgi:type IV pilus assembly protein PilA